MRGHDKLADVVVEVRWGNAGSTFGALVHVQGDVANI